MIPAAGGIPFLMSVKMPTARRARAGAERCQFAWGPVLPGEFVFYFPCACFEFCFLVCFPCCFLLPSFLSPPPFAKQAGEVRFCFLFCFLFCFQCYNAHISGFPRSHVSAFPHLHSCRRRESFFNGSQFAPRALVAGEGERQGRGSGGEGKWGKGNPGIQECANVGTWECANAGMRKRGNAEIQKFGHYKIENKTENKIENKIEPPPPALRRGVARGRGQGENNMEIKLENKTKNTRGGNRKQIPPAKPAPRQTDGALRLPALGGRGAFWPTSKMESRRRRGSPPAGPQAI